jgi:hypothetical protein
MSIPKGKRSGNFLIKFSRAQKSPDEPGWAQTRKSPLGAGFWVLDLYGLTSPSQGGSDFGKCFLGHLGLGLCDWFDLGGL